MSAKLDEFAVQEIHSYVKYITEILGWNSVLEISALTFTAPKVIYAYDSR